jgi:hypothetical protein
VERGEERRTEIVSDDRTGAGEVPGDSERGLESPEPMDLLSTPELREQFEQTSAALEAADLVRRLRRQAFSANGVRGISQEELAQRTGLSQPRISQIEKAKGRDGVTYAVLRKIAYACGLDWGTLLRDAVRGARRPAPVARADDAAAAASGPAARAPAQTTTYKGQPVVTAVGVVLGRVVDVLFNELGAPQAVRVGPLAGGPLALVDVAALRWDPAMSSFVLALDLSSRPQLGIPAFGTMGFGGAGAPFAGVAEQGSTPSRPHDAIRPSEAWVASPAGIIKTPDVAFLRLGTIEPGAKSGGAAPSVGGVLTTIWVGPAESGD